MTGSLRLRHTRKIQDANIPVPLIALVKNTIKPLTTSDLQPPNKHAPAPLAPRHETHPPMPSVPPTPW